MQCVLCNKPIEQYDARLHEFRVDAQRSVAVCQHCIDRFLNWQHLTYTKLFPTKSMKRAAEWRQGHQDLKQLVHAPDRVVERCCKRHPE